MSAKAFQSACCNLLKDNLDYPDELVTTEWPAFVGNKHSYSPKVDIAVGPYSTVPGHTLEREYNDLVHSEKMHNLLYSIYIAHIENIRSAEIPEDRFELVIPDFDHIIMKNQNARCLLAIEIENTSSKKHIMGSLVNAASLGRVGIGVAYTDSVKRTFIRILNYMAFLRRVEKNTYDTTNFLIVTKDQFEAVLQNNE